MTNLRIALSGLLVGTVALSLSEVGYAQTDATKTTVVAAKTSTTTAGSTSPGVIVQASTTTTSSPTSLVVTAPGNSGVSPYQSGFFNIAFPAGPSAYTIDLPSLGQAIPQGKMAVIEHVSVAGVDGMGTSETLRGFLICQTDGSGEARIALTFQEQQGDILGIPVRVASQAVKCYASSGRLTVQLINSKPHSFSVYVTGYLISE